MTDKPGAGHRDPVISGQYEVYPYPPRDPADEASRLVTGSPSHIAELDHYLFRGRRDFQRPFRALIAGGGTGDASVMLAQQLADTGGPHEVVHLDLSEASTDIARARAAARGLRNIRFVAGSILDVAALAPGRYDYIDCCGVLHHLEDPPAALAGLAAMLADDGGMGLMVYAPYGRTGVYQAQSMLTALDRGDAPADRVRLARSLLDVLPPTNWLKRNPQLADHLQTGDAGLYDLLLHGRDRAYTVGDVAVLCDAGGLRPVAFIEPIRYDPLLFGGPPELQERLATLSWLERCAFAELMAGNLKTHVLYAVGKTRTESTVAEIGDGELAPVLIDMDGPAAAAKLRESGQMRVDLEGLRLGIPVDEASCAALALIDGTRTVAEIRDAVGADALDRIFSLLNGLNTAFLRLP